MALGQPRPAFTNNKCLYLSLFLILLGAYDTPDAVRFLLEGALHLYFAPVAGINYRADGCIIALDFYLGLTDIHFNIFQSTLVLHS